MYSKKTPAFSCCVEVSGWDHEHNFFVEKALMEWLPGGMRRARLQAMLFPGSVVFIRSGDRCSAIPSFPEACRVDSVTPGDQRGHQYLTLTLVKPRRSAAPFSHSGAGATFEPASKTVLHRPGLQYWLGHIPELL
jgi:hypothetical protein